MASANFRYSFAKSDNLSLVKSVGMSTDPPAVNLESPACKNPHPEGRMMVHPQNLSEGEQSPSNISLHNSAH